MKKSTYFVAVILVSSAMMLGACRPSDWCDQEWATPTPRPTEEQPDKVDADHVIVIGPKKQIRELINSVSGVSPLAVGLPQPESMEVQQVMVGMCPFAATNEGPDIDWGPMPKLKRVKRINLPYVRQALDTCTAMPQHEQDLFTSARIDPSGSEWAMDLYRIPNVEEWLADLYEYRGETTGRYDPISPAVWVAAALNCKSAEMYQSPLVLADPTFLTGKVVATPWTGDGGPWTGDGGPWTGDGGPWTGDGGPVGDPATAPSAFWGQWAFQSETGINLSHYDQSAETWIRRQDIPTGEGVIVGVFDSSPFARPALFAIDWVTPTLDLTVKHLKTLNEPPRVPNTPISNHGLYVSGLIHAVAPDSEIYLYRVLDKNLRGDMWTLNVALDSFIRKAIKMRTRESYRGAVINMSLGGFPPEEYSLLRWQRGLGARFALREDWETLLPMEVISLGTLLSAAHCHGIVSVGAAGNHSYDRDSDLAFDSQIPGLFAEVISVSASRPDGQRACFSNLGDVTAPGGSVENPTPCKPWVTTPCCTPSLDKCAYKESCDYGLISLALPCGNCSSGYVFWAGTSFSTPLVSGVVALLLDQNGGWSPVQEQALDGSLARDISEMVKNGTVSVDGRIDVMEILSEASSSTPD